MSTPRLDPDVTAQAIAALWHGGGGTALYQFASTGAIDVDAIRHELIREYADATLDDAIELDTLSGYVDSRGSRGPVSGWYERVICHDHGLQP
jgi:hypothetical protein